MRVRLLVVLAVASVPLLAGCGTKPTATGTRPAATTPQPPVQGNQANQAPTTTVPRKPVKATPECQGMVKAQNLRLRIPRVTGAEKTKAVQEYQAAMNEVKPKLPAELQPKVDQRVALTVKASNAPLAAEDKATSDGIDKEIDAWWDANCF